MRVAVFFGYFVFVLLPSLVLAAPGQSIIDAARKEKKVVWWAIMSPPEAKGMIDRFNRLYPFIEIEHWRGGPTALTERVWSDYHSKRHSWDVLYGADAAQPEFITTGVLRKWSVPGLDAVHKSAKDPNGYWVTLGGSVSVAAAYNTRLVSSKEAPKSWEDLLNPKWKGRIAINAERIDAYVVLTQPGGWGKEKVRSYVRSLAANKPQIIKGRVPMMSLLAAGEFPIATGDVVLHRMNQLIKKGAPLDWTRTSPVLFTGGSIVVNKNAPHPNALQVWLDWLFSPDGTQALEDVTTKGSPYPGSGSSQSIAVKGLEYIGEDARYVNDNREFHNELQKTLGIR
ncbi:MAG: ABC transporter substrate-binding protein [Candidatus Binatia bacterium]